MKKINLFLLTLFVFICSLVVVSCPNRKPEGHFLNTVELEGTSYENIRDDKNEFVIRFDNCVLKNNLAVGDDVTEWIVLPRVDGIKYQVKFINKDFTEVMIRLTGEPTTSINATELQIEIPSSFFKDNPGKVLCNTKKSTLKINEQTIKFIASDTTITGDRGDAITSQEIDLSIEGALFASLEAESDLSTWFHPVVDGLTYKAKNAIPESGAASLTIVVEGTPKVRKQGDFRITLQENNLIVDKNLKSLMAQGNLSYEIAYPETSASMKTTVIDGVLDNPIEKTFDITLKKGQFNKGIKDSTVNSWIYKSDKTGSGVITGLNYTVSDVSDDLHTVTVSVSGTVTKNDSATYPIEDAFAIIIPKSAILDQDTDVEVETNASHYHIQDTPKAVAMFDSKLEIYAAKNGEDVTASGKINLNYGHFADSVTADSSIASWFTLSNSKTLESIGLDVKVSSVENKSGEKETSVLTFAFSGSATDVIDSTINVIIEKSLYEQNSADATEKEDLTVNTLQSFINVTDVTIEDTATENTTLEGETGSAITDTFITVKLDDDHKFAGLAELVGKENAISSWFYKKDTDDSYKPFVINGLKYTLSEVNGNELKLKISGNPLINTDVQNYPITDGIVVMVSKDYIEKNLKTVYVETKTSYNIGKSSVVKLDKEKISAFRDKNLSATLTLSIEGGEFDTAKITEKKAEIPSWFTLNGEGSIADLTFALDGTPTTSSFVVSVTRSESTALDRDDIVLSKIDVKVPSYAISGATKDKVLTEALTYDLRNYPTAKITAGSDFNAAINGAEKSYDYTIRLSNAKFAANVSVNADVESWFTSSLSDLSYNVKSVVNTVSDDINDSSKAYSEVVITVKGTSTTINSNNITISIPSSYIAYYDANCNVNKTNITPTSETTYKYAIVDLSASLSTTASFGSNDIYASVGYGFYNNATTKNEFEIPIVLSGGGFKQMSAGIDVLTWFAESPSAPSTFLSHYFDGITATVKDAVNDGDSKLTIVLSGTPRKNTTNTTTKTDEMKLCIPKEYIKWELKDLPLATAQKYNIKEKTVAIDSSNTQQIRGYVGYAIGSKDFTIIPKNAEFNVDNLSETTNVADFFLKDTRNKNIKDYITSMTFVVSSTFDVKNKLRITINGTPSKALNTTIYYTIPKEYLLDEYFDIESTVDEQDNGKWNIVDPPTISSADNEKNFIASTGGNSKEVQYTISISNGKFNTNTLSPLVDKDISAFFKNTVAGLSYTLKSVSESQMVVSISGSPTEVPDADKNAIKFVVTKNYITPIISAHPGAYTGAEVTLGSYVITEISALVDTENLVINGIYDNNFTADIPVTLKGGASFKEIAKDKNVSSWFDNYKALNTLSFVVKDAVKELDRNLTINVSGKPTSTNFDNLSFTLPSEVIVNDLQAIKVNANGAKFNIGSATTVSNKLWAESSHVLSDGEDIDIVLDGFEFDDGIASISDTDLTKWFSLESKAKRLTRSASDFSWLSFSYKELSTDKKTLTVQLKGTPESDSDGGEYSIKINIPKDYITELKEDSGAPSVIKIDTNDSLIIQVASRKPFTWKLYDSASFAKRSISESDTVKFSENKGMTKTADGSDLTFADDDTALLATGTESEFSFPSGLSRRGYKIAGLSKNIGGDIEYDAFNFVHPDGSFYMFLLGDEVQEGQTQNYYVVWEPDTDVNGLVAWTPTDTSNGGTVLPATFSLDGIKSLDDSIVTDKEKYTSADYLDYNKYNEVYLPVKGYTFAIRGDDRDKGDYIINPGDLKDTMMSEEIQNDFMIGEDVITGYILETLRAYNNTLPESKRFELPLYSNSVTADEPTYDADSGIMYNEVSYGVKGANLKTAIPIAPLDVSYPLTYVTPTQSIIIANAMTAYYNAHTSGKKLTYAYTTDYTPADEDSDTVVRKMKDAIELINFSNNLYGQIITNMDLSKHNGPASLDATGFRLPTGKEFHIASSIIPKSDYDDDAAIYNQTKIWNEGRDNAIEFNYGGTLYPQQQLFIQTSGARTPISGDPTDEDITAYIWYSSNSTADSDSNYFMHGFKRSNGTIKDKLPNNIGLYGMNGNVYQWVDTTYSGFLQIHSNGFFLANVPSFVSSYMSAFNRASGMQKNPTRGIRLARTIR